MSAPPIHTEQELIVRIANGDEMAFRQLFHEYWPNIYGVAFMLTKSVPQAEDMVQDIFLKVWQKREELPGIESFRDWLFIVARNHIFTELRRLSRNIPFTNTLLDYFRDQRQDPEQQLLNKEAGRLIRASVDRLPPQQQAVYRMSREQGFSQDEIAVELGISKNTVRNHMAQALRNIRGFLEQHSEGLLLYICVIETWLK